MRKSFFHSHPFRVLRGAVAGLTALAVLAVPVLPAHAVPASAPAPASAQPAVPASANPLYAAPSASESQQAIVLTGVSGRVERWDAVSSAWKELTSADTLRSSDRLRTGPDGTARIEFDGKIRIQVLPDSELTIEEARRDLDERRQTLLKLDIGNLKADVDKLASGSSFKVKTPTAVSTVRGTTFYLNVVRFAQGVKGILTNLYVDKGRVDFAAVENELNALLVEAFHASSISGDGEKTPPKELTPEEREAFIRSFEEAAKNAGNPQLGVETGPLPGAPPVPGGTGAGPGDGAFRDAIERLIDELVGTRNENAGIEDEKPFGDITLLGALRLTALLLSEGLPLSGNFDFDNVSGDGGFDLGIVSDDRGEALDRAFAANTAQEALAAIGDLQDIRDREKNELRQTLASILDNQDLLNEDAEQERRFDAQTGKVFTDVHGNRVRTDQYIYHEPGTDLVRLVSMTLRTGEYQTGVTSFEFGAQFNADIPEGTLLRELPWNDYLNVVTDEEFEAAYLYGSAPVYSSQYIVHETAGEEGPSLYPTAFYAEFKNPAGDRVRFSEDYSGPFHGEFSFDDGETETGLWFQSRIGELTEIVRAGGFETLEEASVSYGSAWNGNYQSSVGNADLIGSNEGSQTEGWSEAGELIGQLDTGAAVDAIGGLPQNDDGIVDNDLHPAYFQDRLDVNGQDGLTLNAFFLPIDNLGRVLDAPGFRLEGLRDLVNPNTRVVGGQYNLEVILSFGQTYPADGEEFLSDHFVEDFRIDAIITPEIFQPYGIDRDSDFFKDRLIPDNDDGPCGECLTD